MEVSNTISLVTSTKDVMLLMAFVSSFVGELVCEQHNSITLIKGWIFYEILNRSSLDGGITD